MQVTDLALPGLEFWLARLAGLTRLINRLPGHGLAPAIGETGSLAVLGSEGDTFAYLTCRAGSENSAHELGICAYGPRGDSLAESVADRIRAWAAEQPTTTTSIEIYALGCPVPSPDELLLVVPKEQTQIAVRTTRAT